MSYKGQMGVSSIAYGNWDLMNTAQRIQYEKEIGLSDGQNYDYLSKTDVNWLDAVFNDRAMLQSHEISVAGASDKTNYFISGGYYNQDGIAPGSSFERFSLRYNFEQKLTKKLSVGINTNFNFQNIQQADEGLKEGQTSASISGGKDSYKFIITVRKGAAGNGWL